MTTNRKPAPCTCDAPLGTICAADCAAWTTLVLHSTDCRAGRCVDHCNAAALLAVTVGPRN
jgi:hypothetical protein